MKSLVDSMIYAEIITDCSKITGKNVSDNIWTKVWKETRRQVRNNLPTERVNTLSCNVIQEELSRIFNNDEKKS